MIPAIPSLGIYPEKNKNFNLKKYRYPKVHSSTIYNSQDMKTTQVSINRWQFLLGLRRNITQILKTMKILPFAATWIILDNTMLQFSCSVMSDSLQPCGLQYATAPCPSPAPRVYPNSCPLSRWCHYA